MKKIKRSLDLSQLALRAESAVHLVSRSINPFCSFEQAPYIALRVLKGAIDVPVCLY
jgi:hypothetical protein